MKSEKVLEVVRDNEGVFSVEPANVDSTLTLDDLIELQHTLVGYCHELAAEIIMREQGKNE